MCTLITQRIGQDHQRRCDAHCYNAQHDACDCCCGGMNHGQGLQRAIDHTRDLILGELDYIHEQGFEVEPTLARLADTRQPSLF